MSEIEPTQLQAPPRSASSHRTGTGRVTVERAQLAADAPGRVEVVVLRPPADVLEPAEPAPPPVERGESLLLTRLMIYDGWVAIATLAALLVAVFVLGLWFTR